MSSSSQLCLVTGGGGFLATQIILLLVERGYRVRSCVRSAAKGAAWIKKQAETHPTISEHVEFAYVADMGVAGAYDRCIKDVSIVFHTASPLTSRSRLVLCYSTCGLCLNS